WTVRICFISILRSNNKTQHLMLGLYDSDPLSYVPFCFRCSLLLYLSSDVAVDAFTTQDVGVAMFAAQSTLAHSYFKA
ncbi:hypothetical protein Ancab_002354, partial [Ancistrocladus abbreviatus]